MYSADYDATGCKTKSQINYNLTKSSFSDAGKKRIK